MLPGLAGKDDSVLFYFLQTAKYGKPPVLFYLLKKLLNVHQDFFSYLLFFAFSI